MRVQGSHRYKAPPEVMAALFTDRKALIEATLGMRSLRPTGPDQYTAEIRVGIGGFYLEYAGTMEITDRRGADGYTILLDAATTNGYARGKCSLSFLPMEGQRMEVQFDADVEFGGAQKLYPAIARGLVEFFMLGMERVLEERQKQARGRGQNRR